jgi:hypothetical protein
VERDDRRHRERADTVESGDMGEPHRRRVGCERERARSTGGIVR